MTTWHVRDDGPSVDPAVLRALHDVDPSIYPVWRNWQPDLVTGAPLLTEDGERLWNPRWWIVKICRDGVHRQLFSVQFFDYRVPYRIKSDVARHLSASQIEQRIDDAQASAEKMEAAQREGDVADFVAANRSKLGTVFDGDNLKRPAEKRDAKIFSYDGIANRTTGRDAIMPSAKEAGWEMPESMQQEDDQ